MNPDPDDVARAEILALRWCKESGQVRSVEWQDWGVTITLADSQCERRFFASTLLEAIWELWESLQ